ncbi:MAG: nitroreductase family protein [Microthrixaceae bacterium]|nr:nitroreductase family protein [Microthrixaceae bacterium]MCO5318209.1 nitroreductase family protein [Microthrixaceae bacterium]
MTIGADMDGEPTGGGPTADPANEAAPTDGVAVSDGAAVANERAPEGDRSFGAISDRLDMSLREAMSTQRAVRKVLPDEVDDEVVLACIELALRAPTGSNGQNWEFVVVRDAATKAAFARQYRKAWKLYGGVGERIAARNPSMAKIMRAVRWQVDHFEEIPVVVVPCLVGANRFAPLSLAQSSHYGSIYPSVQNLLLAARAMGLGASLITLPLWNPRRARRLLGLPFGVQPICMVPLGWPRGRYGPTTRKPVGEVVHLDRFGNRRWKA